MARITYAYLASLTSQDLNALSRRQAQGLLREARKKFQARVRQLEKVASSVYSHSLNKMQDFYSETETKAPSQTNLQDAKKELARLRDFFASEGSTVEGARKIQREQDARIFGEDEFGRPKSRMTLNQRKRFWSIYEEFSSSYTNAEYLYGSNRIQQFLGQMIKADPDRKFGVDSNTFEFLLSMLEEQYYYDTEYAEETGLYNDWDTPAYSETRNY